MDQRSLSFALLGPCRAMTERGIRIDDELRMARIDLLMEEASKLLAEAQELVAPFFNDLERWDLALQDKVCKACHNGKKKRLSCAACGGQGRSYSLAFNLGSDEQLKDLLYNALGLPKRVSKKKVTVDEEALRSLLALDKSGVVERALRYNKLSTIRSTYERMEPDRTEHLHSVFNPAGTYTGRFSSAEAFYVENSTNLQNLTEGEAKRDPLFAVRDCVVPEPGEVLLYADLSQAEARVSAACANDTELLERWADPEWDVHKWTAAHIFGVSESSVTDAQRTLGKTCRHALNYGMGPNKFWRTVNEKADLTGIAVTLPQARDIWMGYHKLHPKLEDEWWNKVERQLYTDGKITATHCGWDCNFYPKFDPATGHLDAESLKAAIACEPQHTVAHVLNEILLELWQREHELEYRVLLQVHDAVLVGARAANATLTAGFLSGVFEKHAGSVMVHGHKVRIPTEVFVCKERWSQKERVL